MSRGRKSTEDGKIRFWVVRGVEYQSLSRRYPYPHSLSAENCRASLLRCSCNKDRCYHSIESTKQARNHKKRQFIRSYVLHSVSYTIFIHTSLSHSKSFPQTTQTNHTTPSNDQSSFSMPNSLSPSIFLTQSSKIHQAIHQEHRHTRP